MFRITCTRIFDFVVDLRSRSVFVFNLRRILVFVVDFRNSFISDLFSTHSKHFTFKYFGPSFV